MSDKFNYSGDLTLGRLFTRLKTTLSGYAKQSEVDSLSGKIDDKLDADKLPETINTALAQAKESGKFDGAPGISPHIGDNGNWFVGNKDTGVQAQGDDYVLTAQDKAEIAGIVLSELPKYNGEVEDV